MDLLSLCAALIQQVGALRQMESEESPAAAPVSKGPGIGCGLGFLLTQGEGKSATLSFEMRCPTSHINWIQLVYKHH